jgi:hypothetical protein
MRQMRKGYALALLAMLFSIFTIEGHGYWRCDNPECPITAWHAALPTRCCCDAPPEQRIPHESPHRAGGTADSSQAGICGCVLVMSPDSARTAVVPISARPQVAGLAATAAVSTPLLPAPALHRLARSQQPAPPLPTGVVDTPHRRGPPLS